MKDDLPKAYTAYQQALYHLQNPKVRNREEAQLILCRNPSFGTVSAFSTIDMDPSTTLKRHSRVC